MNKTRINYQGILIGFFMDDAGTPNAITVLWMEPFNEFGNIEDIRNVEPLLHLLN